MAYRDNDNKIQVLIVRTGKWASLPSEMIDLLCDDSMKFVGVNVSADLKKIGKDFNVDGLKASFSLKLIHQHEIDASDTW